MKDSYWLLRMDTAHSMSSILSNNLLKDSILSRKIALRSYARHFAKWKIRQFSLDKHSRVLNVTSPNNETTSIYLDSPTVSIGRHYYAGDNFFWLWLKYFDNSEDCAKEIVMKFEKKENFELWEKVYIQNYFLLIDAVLCR